MRKDKDSVYAGKKAEEELQHRMAVSMSARDGVYL